MEIRLRINKKEFKVDVKPGETLLELLRRLGFKSVKKGCDTGSCGACTVLLGDKPIASCLMLAVQADGCSVTTVEGLASEGKLHPVQEAFIEVNAPQCGYCTPGMIMTAVSFLRENPNPSRQEIREAISGNICRCSGYVKIVDAIMLAASKMRSSDGIAR